MNKNFVPFTVRILPLLITLVTTTAWSEVLKIDDVINMVLHQGLYKNDIDYGYQKAEATLLLSEANFDTQLYTKIQHDDSKLESLSGVSSLRDKIDTWALGVSRKFSTGSSLGLDYSFIHKDSDLSAALIAAGASPNLYYHLTTLTFKQDLLNNAFGYKDQRLLLSSDLQYKRAKIEHDEAMEELVIQSIKLFLDTYTAQENLKQSLAARDKYLLLLKSVQQKNRMGFDDKSELIKTRAEVQNQERNVKSATLLYETLETKLYSFLNSAPPKNVELALPDSNSLPKNLSPTPPLNQLRKMKSSDLLLQATEADKEAAANNQKANLNFFAQAASSGLDPSNSSAISEMNGQDHSKLTVGLEFQLKWGGSSQKADQIAKNMAHAEALNNQQKTQNDLREILDRTQNNVSAKYTIATHAEETVKLWEDAMKSQERNHRFGRITTTELILDYTSYFRAKSSLSMAKADFQMSLYEYRAARDQLLSNNEVQKQE